MPTPNRLKWISGVLNFLDTTGAKIVDVEALIRVIDVTIPVASVLTLNATPVTLVAAPGAGKHLVFESMLITKAAGVAYGGIAAGEDLSVKYTNAAGLEVATCETTGFLDQATAVFRHLQKRAVAQAAAAVSDITPVTNSPLVAHLLSGEITTGDQPIKCRVYYRVEPDAIP